MWAGVGGCGKRKSMCGVQGTRKRYLRDRASEREAGRRGEEVWLAVSSGGKQRNEWIDAEWS